MSVPVSKRGKSKTEFFHSAYKLNDEITQLLLRDFGLKTISRDLNAFTYRAKMSEEDRQIFMDMDKYFLSVFPEVNKECLKKKDMIELMN